MSDTENAIRAGLLTFGPSPLLNYYRTHRAAEFFAAQSRLMDEIVSVAMAIIANANGAGK